MSPISRTSSDLPSVSPLTVYRSPTGAVDLRLGELLRQRELIYFLLLRTLKLRYRQAAIGVLWAVIQPVATMLIFSVLFSRVTPSVGVPYPLFVLAGLLPWQLFAHAVSFSSLSIVSSQNLVSKVAFPRLALPIASVLAGLVDLAVALPVFAVLLVHYERAPGVAVLALPVFLAIELAAVLGVAFWLSALVVRYRDVKFVLPFLAQVWMFATPLFYDAASVVPMGWRDAYRLNPLVGVIDGIRWALLGTDAPSVELCLVSSALSLALLASGAAYFRRSEMFFADTI